MSCKTNEMLSSKHPNCVVKLDTFNQMNNPTMIYKIRYFDISNEMYLNEVAIQLTRVHLYV